MALISDGSRSLIKVQEASRALFDREGNRILACYSVGCVLSDGIINGSLQPVAVINALWVLFDMFRSEGPAQSPFLHTFLHVLKHHKSPGGVQFFIRNLINYPSEKFAVNHCADKILLLDDSHARPPLSPNVDVPELQRKCAAQVGPVRRLSSAASAWLRPCEPVAPSASASPSPTVPPLASCLGFEAPFPRPPPPMLPVTARELRWLNPFPEPSFIFCSDLMSDPLPRFKSFFSLTP
jgi:hypothetical protein